jgi:hypothetical protein
VRFDRQSVHDLWGQTHRDPVIQIVQPGQQRGQLIVGRQAPVGIEHHHY